MDEKSLLNAKKDVDDALEAVENIEGMLDDPALTKEYIKDRFDYLSEKVKQLEDILKGEGIL